MTIRPVTPNDAAATTFAIEPPTAADFAQRIATITSTHPFLVAEDLDGTVVG